MPQSIVRQDKTETFLSRTLHKYHLTILNAINRRCLGWILQSYSFLRLPRDPMPTKDQLLLRGDWREVTLTWTKVSSLQQSPFSEKLYPKISLHTWLKLTWFRLYSRLCAFMERR